MDSLKEEHERRLRIWRQVKNAKKVDASLTAILGVYKGKRGIYRDKKTTKLIDANTGVTVSVLHSGEHYSDEIEEDFILYSYPKTKKVGHDRNDIRATKLAKDLELPIFLNDKTNKEKPVKIGYVVSWDDAIDLFLIEFREPDSPTAYNEPTGEDSRFDLQSKETKKFTRTPRRPNQAAFRFNVLKMYGPKCAVCNIKHSKMLIAAHVCPKEKHGTDDWRNGIVLCANHHNAFDAHLFGINPEGLTIEIAKNITKEELGIVESTLNTQNRKQPHTESLEWKHKEFKPATSKK